MKTVPGRRFDSRRAALAALVALGPASACACGCQWVVGSYAAGGAADAAAVDGTTGSRDAAEPGDGASGEGASGDGASADEGIDVSLDARVDADAQSANPSDGATGTDGAAKTDAGGGCTEGTQQCVGTGVATCTAGAWATPWPCATGACANGACSGGTSGASNPSCSIGGAGLTDCGTGQSCCASFEVAGGTFDRTYTTGSAGATGLADPATVSGLRIDRYLATVGRFRQFVTAWDDGNATPAAGSGKHAHLNAGQGLVNAVAGGGAPYETGWEASYSGGVAPSDSNLTSCVIAQDGSLVSYSTWTPTPQAGSEDLPINCVTWYEAYAFCIWDGGFLPSEAEAEYAAAGGDAQREYAWGAPAPGTADQYAVYGCFYPLGAGGNCTSVANIAPVGSAPGGAGLWGQLDLAGDVFEWTLDAYSAYVDPCVDCANLGAGGARSLRGGAFAYDEASLQVWSRMSSALGTRNGSFGFRCARTP